MYNDQIIHASSHASCYHTMYAVAASLFTWGIQENQEQTVWSLLQMLVTETDNTLIVDVCQFIISTVHY